MVLAGGTVAYHVSLLLGLSRSGLAGLWIGLAVAGLVVLWRSSTMPPLPQDVLVRPSSSLTAAVFAVAAATVAYMALGSSSWWWLFWACAAAALLGGVGNVLRPRPAPGPLSSTAVSPLRLGLVLVLAVLLGIAALVTNRPDLDDVYVVNRSVYVEQHNGAIPTEDVLFSDQEHSGQRAPLRSPAFEVLLGIVAALAPVATATVAYLWFAPLAAAASVLACWRLVRALCCRRPEVAVAVATVFLVLDGSTHAGFGNLSFARLWQGKIALVAVLVPLLWVYAVRWGRDGSARHLVLLAAANIGAVGLSSTGLFVAPIATGVASVGPAMAVRSPRRLLAAAAATAYPAALALLNRAADAGLEAVTPDAAPALAPWSRWAFVFGRPVSALVALALALGWLAVRDRASRAALAVGPLLVLLLLYGPRLLDPLRMLTPGAVSILWRAVWVLPLPALIGIVATLPWSTDRLPKSATVLAVAAVAVSAGVFVVTTTPVTASDNRASLGWPTWKTGGEPRVAERLIGGVPAGSVVAGPFDVDRVVPLLSSNVRAVDPRPGWYVAGVNPAPRQLVQRGLTNGIAEDEAPRFAAAVDRLGVDAVALPTRLRGDPVRVVLEQRAFVLRGIEGQYLILTRSTPPNEGSP